MYPTNENNLGDCFGVAWLTVPMRMFVAKKMNIVTKAQDRKGIEGNSRE